MESLIIAIGAIIAALVSGIFAVINFIVSKDQKISEFRQNWIDELRIDISEYVGTNLILFEHLKYMFSKPGKGDQFAKFINDNSSQLVKIELLRNRILLRLNPIDDIGIIKAVEEINKYWTGHKDFKKDSIQNDCQKLVNKSQKLLKNEWNRVKRGEKTFLVVKYGFVVMVFLLILYLILILSGFVDIPNFLVKLNN